ncbi:MAG TPA: ATP-binding protein [Burkholderiaceae bacterium]
MIIAIVGAESTGKTALAHALAVELGATCVAEYLREWCDREGRTPRADEQAAIAAEQARRIEAAALKGPVICDTTPLMTAVYSDFIFGDQSLYASTLAWQGRCALTLLTGLDLPWVADGIQRASPAVQAPIDQLIRKALDGAGIAWQRVEGHGDARRAVARRFIESLKMFGSST